MQAIITKYHGPTDTKGSRYSAECDRGRIMIGADDALSPEGNHEAARNALIDRFVREDAERYGTQRNPWEGPWVSGGLPSGGVAHVNLFGAHRCFRFVFTGRRIGAIGKTYEIEAERIGATPEEAQASLWDRYEHISVTECAEVTK